MRWNMALGSIVVLMGLGAGMTYLGVRQAPASASEPADAHGLAPSDETPRPKPVEPVAVPRARSSKAVDAAALRASMRQAFLEAIEAARERPSGGVRPAHYVRGNDPSSMPDMEMTWEQYRGWTKFSAAVARRDYRAAEDMLAKLQSLFGEPLATALLDAYVQDYQTYLESVIASRCEGHDPESIWRKTIYMSFALARLNRSSASLDRLAGEARSVCGYSA